jgi:Flp pilus assembly protein TadD, contains TPR repeats
MSSVKEPGTSEGRHSGPETGKAASAKSPNLAQWLPVALVILAIWLAYQILLVPLTSRSPPGLAARINPNSPLALTRVAEAEYVDGRYENAEALARESLRKAPFNVRALRVFGLSIDKGGRTDDADAALTLAGNWSLRDDPAHAWLVIHRLKQGDVAGAFAHADTLMRRGRQTDSFFTLLSTAASQEPRIIPLLVALLAQRPPWQHDFFNRLYESPQGAQLAVNLTIRLEAANKPVSEEELTRLYSWVAQNTELSNLETVRRQIGRPARSGTGLLDDGQFDDEDLIKPFGWTIRQAPGLQTEITSDLGDDDNPALRVSVSGIGQKEVVSQYVVAPSGRLQLSGRLRQEQGRADDTLGWQVSCLYGGGIKAFGPLQVEAVDSRAWQSFAVTVDVPTAGCSGLVLQLQTKASTNRVSGTIWFDDLTLAPLGR